MGRLSKMLSFSLIRSEASSFTVSTVMKYAVVFVGGLDVVSDILIEMLLAFRTIGMS